MDIQFFQRKYGKSSDKGRGMPYGIPTRFMAANATRALDVDLQYEYR